MSNRIRPNRALIGPLSTAPNVKPRHMIELIQEPSSAVIGPVRRWLLSLISTGRLGEHQPKAMPYDNTARFTIQILKKKKKNSMEKCVSRCDYDTSAGSQQTLFSQIWNRTYRMLWSNIDSKYASFQNIFLTIEDHKRRTVAQTSSWSYRGPRTVRWSMIRIQVANQHSQCSMRAYSYNNLCVISYHNHDRVIRIIRMCVLLRASQDKNAIFTHTNRAWAMNGHKSLITPTMDEQKVPDRHRAIYNQM